MALIIQTISNMLILGAMYILVGLGFAFLYNMLGFFNVAHGSIYMGAAYLGYMFMVALGINPWLGFILVVLIIAILGIFLERAFFRPFLKDFNRQVMVGVALIVILNTTMTILVGSKNYIIPTLITGSVGSGAYSVTWQRVLTFGIGVIILGLVLLFVNRTKWGYQMQAIAQNSEAASLQGINIHRISAIVTALGCGLAAVAGVLVGSMYILSPFMGSNILTKILALVTLAGIGSFWGILLMGLILGILFAGLPILLPGAASDAVAASVVCVILLFRPQGFFGHEA